MIITWQRWVIRILIHTDEIDVGIFIPLVQEQTILVLLHHYIPRDHLYILFPSARFGIEGVKDDGEVVENKMGSWW